MTLTKWCRWACSGIAKEKGGYPMRVLGIPGALAAIRALMVAAAPARAANEIVLGLTNIKSGPLETPGEGAEIAVDIAVAEINAAGGINGMKLRIVKLGTGTDPKQAVVAASFSGQRSASPVISLRCRVKGDRGRRPRKPLEPASLRASATQAFLWLVRFLTRRAQSFSGWARRTTVNRLLAAS